MRKFGPIGTKWLKIIHIILVVFFLGGILSSLALYFALDLSNFDNVYVTYKNFIVISDHIVKYGAQGIILVGIAYAAFTNWGFLKYRWIVAKWIIFLTQTIVGILIVDKITVANMALLERENATALLDPVFLHNHAVRLYVVLFQITLTLLSVVLSVLKPWRIKNKRPDVEQNTSTPLVDIPLA